MMNMRPSVLSHIYRHSKQNTESPGNKLIFSLLLSRAYYIRHCLLYCATFTLNSIAHRTCVKASQQAVRTMRHDALLKQPQHRCRMQASVRERACVSRFVCQQPHHQSTDADTITIDQRRTNRPHTS